MSDLVRRARLLAALLVLLGPSAAVAEDSASPFVDTRLTVTFGDDDVRKRAGESTPESLLPGFGDRPGYQLAYDALNSRYSSRETLAHLALYRKLPGFWPSLTTEAALVVRLQIDHATRNQVTLADTGSYLRLRWSFGHRGESVSLVAFPFDSDRFRIGHLYRISLGSNSEYPRKGWVGAPGAKLQLDWRGGSVFVGFKAVPCEEPYSGALANTVIETQYSALTGASVDLLRDRLRLDLEGAFLGQGSSPLKDVAGQPFYSVGASGRVVWHHELPIEESIDLTLYTNDPNRPFRAFAPVRYRPGTVGYLISAEVVALWQHLASPDTYGQMVFQRAVAAALQHRLQVGYWRLELTAMVREVAFLLHTTPSYTPFQALPAIAQPQPELLFAISTDYHFPRPHLTPGISVGLLLPASLTNELKATTSGSSAPPTVISRNKVVVRDDLAQILPEGVDPLPVVQGRLQLRADLSSMLYLLGWVQYRYDPNNTVIVVKPDLTKSTVVETAHQIGLGVSASVRF